MKIHIGKKNKNYNVISKYDKHIYFLLATLIFLPAIINFFGGINYVTTGNTNLSTLLTLFFLL